MLFFAISWKMISDYSWDFSDFSCVLEFDCFIWNLHHDFNVKASTPEPEIILDSLFELISKLISLRNSPLVWISEPA